MYLSRELGCEFDVSVDYQLNKHVAMCFEGGYFVPGRYYRQDREDTSGSLLTPFVRGDGNADPAYQLELSLEFKF